MSSVLKQLLQMFCPLLVVSGERANLVHYCILTGDGSFWCIVIFMSLIFLLFIKKPIFLTCICLTFLIHKIRIIVLPTFRVVERFKWDSIVKHLISTWKAPINLLILLLSLFWLQITWNHLSLSNACPLNLINFWFVLNKLNIYIIHKQGLNESTEWEKNHVLKDRWELLI